jgi:hypothetical protein
MATMTKKNEGHLTEEDAKLIQKSGLSENLKHTIQKKLEAGELDEVDRNVFEENLRKASKKSDWV